MRAPRSGGGRPLAAGVALSGLLLALPRCTGETRSEGGAGGSGGGAGSAATGGSSGSRATGGGTGGSSGSAATGGSSGSAATGGATGGSSGSGPTSGAAGDAGGDAPFDASDDADADLADARDAALTCATAADCSPADGGSGWCAAVSNCIAGRCVAECPLTGGARTCTVESDCFVCAEDAGSGCPTSAACPAGVFDVQVESSTCSAWSDAGAGLRLTRTASFDCRYLISDTSTYELLGELVRLDDGSGIAELSSLGGWCTGRPAFTGSPRYILSCPDCELVLVGFE